MLGGTQSWSHFCDQVQAQKTAPTSSTLRWETAIATFTGDRPLNLGSILNAFTLAVVFLICAGKGYSVVSAFAPIVTTGIPVDSETPAITLLR